MSLRPRGEEGRATVPAAPGRLAAVLAAGVADTAALPSIHELSLVPSTDGLKAANDWARAKYGRDWWKFEKGERLREANAALAADKRAAVQRDARAGAVDNKRQFEALAAAAAAEIQKQRIERYGSSYKNAVEIYPNYDILHKTFPIGRPVTLQSNFGFGRAATDQAAVDKQLALSTLVEDDVFFFSCVPGWRGGDVAGVRFATTTTTSSSGVAPAAVDSSARKISREISSRLAWMLRSVEGRPCGTSNCFQANYRVRSTDDTSVYDALRYFAPTEASIPDVVNVRAPKYDYHDTTELLDVLEKEFTEAFLTLRMAKHKLTPPLYLLAPVRLTAGLRRNIGFCYVTEGGWIDLSDTLIESSSSAETLMILGIGILECLQTTATQSILLTDIKTGNMVAKRKADGTFDVRMIDFDGVFTVDLNLFSEVGQTTNFCVFFVNALLLISYARKKMPRDVQTLAFFDLAMEVVAMWPAMRALGTAGAFCTLLSADDKFAEDLAIDSRSKVAMDFKNKSKLRPDEFLSTMRLTFYSNLEHYGLDTLVKDVAPQQGGGENSAYIDRIVARIASDWAIPPAAIEARVARITETHFASM